MGIIEASAIFTSVARMRERNVARARAAASSGMPGRRRSRNVPAATRVGASCVAFGPCGRRRVLHRSGGWTDRRPPSPRPPIAKPPTIPKIAGTGLPVTKAIAPFPTHSGGMTLCSSRTTGGMPGLVVPFRRWRRAPSRAPDVHRIGDDAQSGRCVIRFGSCDSSMNNDADAGDDGTIAAGISHRAAPPASRGANRSRP